VKPLTAGQVLDTRHYRVSRADLVRYAGASGDFNPIHWSDRVARAVGLPGVVAHGMYTMALASRALTTWVGHAGIVDFSVRFTHPVVVPDNEEGTGVVVAGVVAEVGSDGLARVDLTVTCAGTRVLGRARASVVAATGVDG